MPYQNLQVLSDSIQYKIESYSLKVVAKWNAEHFDFRNLEPFLNTKIRALVQIEFDRISYKMFQTFNFWREIVFLESLDFVPYIVTLVLPATRNTQKPTLNACVSYLWKHISCEHLADFCHARPDNVIAWAPLANYIHSAAIQPLYMLSIYFTWSWCNKGEYNLSYAFAFHKLISEGMLA